MRFFRLEHPEYASDTTYSRKNPIAWVHQYVVSGTICPLCGAWAGNRRIYVPVEDPNLKKLLKGKPSPIPLEKWNYLFNRSIESLQVPPGLQLQPGDKLGEPIGKITNDRVSDFIFPWEGGILVTEKTKDIIIESKLTGCQFTKIELVDKRSNKVPEKQLPTIYVLIVTGRIKPPTNVERCPVCGRFTANYSIELNEDNWDGNDFLIDENYPELIFVTERVYAVFKEKDLRNFQCRPIYRRD